MLVKSFFFFAPILAAVCRVDKTTKSERKTHNNHRAHTKKTQTEVIFRTASLLFLAAAISRRVSWPAGTTTAWSSSDSAEKLQRKTHRLPPQHLLVGAYTRVCVSVCVRPWNRHILSPSLLHIHTGLGCLCCTRWSEGLCECGRRKGLHDAAADNIIIITKEAARRATTNWTARHAAVK